MSENEFHKNLDKSSEIILSVKGRKSGKDIARPVWFVHEHDRLYLLPVQGSDTYWYKNLLMNPILKISAGGSQISEKGKILSESNNVDNVVRKFQSKYGEGDVKRYYPKTDVAVEVPI